MAALLAPLPDDAYSYALGGPLTPTRTAEDRRLDYAEGRVPAQGWRAELDLTTEAAEVRAVGRLGRLGATVAAYARREWEDGDTTAGVRVSVPMGRSG